MTDRIRHLTVTLDRDYREDDVQCIVDAISLIRGIAGIEKRVETLPDMLAIAAVSGRVRIALHDAIETVFKQDGVKL